jgi:hypothetical protein
MAEAAPDRSSAAPRLRLVTRGDDAASCRSANRAILEAFENGILRNVSVMACAPELGHAAKVLGPAARIRGRGLCVGLHVTLNCEWDQPRWGPVLPPQVVPHLVDERGHLTRTPMDLHQRQADVEQMIAEVQAQLDRLRAVGLAPVYLDQHMGVGWVGGLNDRLARLCEKEGLINTEGQVKGLPREGRGLSPSAPRGGAGGGLTPCSAAGDQHSPRRTHVDDLLARLRAAPPGMYLVVGHPCYDEAEVRAFHAAGQSPGEVAADRDDQRRMFLDPAVLACCRECGVQPIRYDAL